MFSSLKKNIAAQLILLVLVFFACLSIILIGDYLLQQRHDYLQSLLENEQSKIELAYFLQKDVFAINNHIYDLVNASSLAEMQVVLTSLSTLRSELVTALGVLDHGGSIKIQNSKRIDLATQILYMFKYTQSDMRRFNILVIKIRTDLSELNDAIEQFKEIVREKIYVLEGHDLLTAAKKNHKGGHFYKLISPVIERILEHSAGLLQQSQHEKDHIQEVGTYFTAINRKLQIISIVISTVIILFISGIILTTSQRILRKRQRYQEELQESNQSLEKIVKNRDSDLLHEIVNRKNAQQQVKKQADFLLTTIESLSHPFYVVDVENYSIVLANSAALDQRAGTHTTCYSLTHGRSVPCDHIPCPLQKLKESGEPVILERVHYSDNGTETFSEVHGYPIFDETGKLIQMIEYSLDITGKKRAEAALRAANVQLEKKVRLRTNELEKQSRHLLQAQQELSRSERHYRRIIESISDLITVVNSDGVISYVSPSLEKVLGTQRESIIGRNIREMVDPKDIKGVDIRTLYDQYGSGRTLEYWTKASSGEYLLLESSIYNFKRDDGSDGYIFSSRDITLRKRSEEETNKLRLVVEQSPSSVVITDKEGIIEYVNPTFERISGYSFAEAVGQNPRVLKSGKTPESAFKQLWSTITLGQIWRGEFINKKKNGEIYTENVLVIPIIDISGNITNFAAIKENITEIKKAKLVAEKANRAKSDFLSQMSHELRTPLNAVNGFSQLLLNSKKNPLDKKQQGMVEKIYSAGHHLLELINEILDLARIESRQFTLSVEDVDPTVVIDECLPFVLPLAQDKGIQLINRCEKKSYPLIRADLTRVKQVLLNLLSNAVKYNRPEGTVVIDVDVILGELRFIVKDTGIGIPVEKQDDIFTPFVRAVSDPDAIEGTGIGMTITRQLVVKMGGHLGFESEEGVGSLFWFAMPLADSTISIDNTAKELIQDMKDNYSVDSIEKNVLYIEDNKVNIEFLQEFFDELKNFSLTTAMTGEKGLVLAQTMAPDLILMDLNLPGMSGFQVYQQLKSDKKTFTIPVIAVTADVMENTVGHVHEEGFDGYISKPVETRILLEMMLDLLENKYES